MARHWAVIPAAGAGVRMGAAIPKQYLPLAGRTVIEHALACFFASPVIAGITVAVSATDTRWDELQRARPEFRNVRTVMGGAERAHSVLSALQSLRGTLHDEDWVLVHDAVRPCLRTADLERLLSAFGGEDAGGLLAVPLADTLKRVQPDHTVSATLAREGLWRALTPQMFRYRLLREALEATLGASEVPTDEASAMERRGHKVTVVPSSSDNIKITHPDDILLAEAILARRAGGRP